jgi:predicted DNA-binding protein
MLELHRHEAVCATTLSVRLDPVLEARLEAESKRLGISKSDLVKDALELRLGMRDPYALLRRVRGLAPMHRPDASRNTGAGLKARLRAKRSD